MQHRFLLLLVVTLIIALAGCPAPEAPGPRQQRSAQEERLDVVVSILPQQFLVQRIGGEHVEITVLVTPGASPATYEPTPSQMAALEDADVYFRIGMPFEESLMNKIQRAFSDLKVVDATGEIDLRPIDRFTTIGAETAESHHLMDPHTWLDPHLAAKQAETIAEILGDLAPGRAEIFQRNLGDLKADLEQVDAEVAEILKPLEGEKILVFHPAYGYFAEAYGLKQVAVEVEGKTPSTRQMADILAHARANDLTTIFVQPQFSTTAAEAVAGEIGADVVPLDPLAEDYIANLKTIAKRIADAKTAGN